MFFLGQLTYFMCSSHFWYNIQKEVKMNVLVIDDEKLIRDVIKEYLTVNDFFVFEGENGEESLKILASEKIDLIIMDIMMPKMDGFTACKEIRKTSNVPIILLSARSEEFDKLTGFDLGIDDYVVKPFSPKELVARVKAVINRKTNTLKKYQIDGIEIDSDAHEVLIDKKEVNLTPKEYDLLLYLVQNKNIALTRESLLTNVWGYDFYGDDRTIDTHIKTLRSRLGKYRNMIKTVREVGYKFEQKDKK